jgi:hypothetical protein
MDRDVVDTPMNGANSIPNDYLKQTRFMRMLVTVCKSAEDKPKLVAFMTELMRLPLRTVMEYLNLPPPNPYPFQNSSRDPISFGTPSGFGEPSSLFGAPSGGFGSPPAPSGFGGFSAPNGMASINTLPPGPSPYGDRYREVENLPFRNIFLNKLFIDSIFDQHYGLPESLRPGVSDFIRG